MEVVLCGSDGAFFELHEVLRILVSCGGAGQCFLFLLGGAIGAGFFPHLCAACFSGGCFFSRQVLALVVFL